MKLLALDLGTHTGVAHNLGGGGYLVATTETWATKGEITRWGKERATRRRDPRIKRFYDFLCSLPRPDVIAFEDVQFSTYTLQTQLWSGLRSAIWLAFSSDVVIECVPVTTLKRFATGSGSADKALMKKHLLLQHPEWKTATVNSDAVDALWIWYWAHHTLSRGKYGQQ